MPFFTVRQNKRYQATVSLNFVERLASNEMVGRKFRDLGFTEVQVTGKGRTRYVRALWPAKEASAEIPPQIRSIEEIET